MRGRNNLIITVLKADASGTNEFQAVSLEVHDTSWPFLGVLTYYSLMTLKFIMCTLINRFRKKYVQILETSISCGISPWLQPPNASLVPTRSVIFTISGLALISINQFAPLWNDVDLLCSFYYFYCILMLDLPGNALF